MIALPPIDQLRREAAILAIYDLADDKLFHACQMAGISIFDLRGAYHPMALLNARTHAVLLLGLSGVCRDTVIDLTGKNHGFLARTTVLWRAASGEPAFLMVRGPYAPRRNERMAA